MIRRSLLARILLNAMLMVAILFLPWFFVAGIAFLILILFSAWEIILWGIFFDILYASPVPLYFNIPFIFTITFTFLFLVFIMLKRRLVFY
ncbi:MAG TPA: hypothetical protein VJH21_03115 [Candidatus Paceibacterota bacterium]